MRKKGVKSPLKARTMPTILAQAQQLVYILLLWMPSPYQRENLPAMLGFWEAQRHPLPQHSQAKSVCKRGQQVRLVGLKFPVSVSWYYLKRDNGQLEKRFVLSTKPLKASTITWWGKQRWQIEGWFKTAKHRFGLHRFGQGSLLGVYRWLVLSLIAYLLAHWVIYPPTLQIYLTGNKLHKPRLNLFDRKFFCFSFYLTWNE